MKILVEEDDPVSRHMLVKTIIYWGHEVKAAGDGAMAWMLLSINKPPDIAILDWDMPKIKGIDLCEKIRRDPEISNIYLIMLTAKDSKDDMIRGYKHGVDDYLSKPVSADELRSGLNRAVEVVNMGIKIDKRRELRFQNMKRFMEHDD